MTSPAETSHTATDSTADNTTFRRELRRIALPVTLQYLLQSSFSVIDQIMIGQLGTVSVAAIGIAANFISLFNTLVYSVAGAANIIMAQAMGRRDPRRSGKAFFTSLAIMGVLAVCFAAACLTVPHGIMGLYSSDPDTVGAAAAYLRVYALGFIPQILENIVAVYLRCTDAAKVPLYAGIAAAATNTALNLVLIFGTRWTPALGVVGAACASVAAQCVACAVAVVYMVRWRHAGRMPKVAQQMHPAQAMQTADAAGEANATEAAEAAAIAQTLASAEAADPKLEDPAMSARSPMLDHPEWELTRSVYRTAAELRSFGAVLAPMVAGDFLWQLGNNVYASVYGHVGEGHEGTVAMAAMTLINPMTTLVFGALSGLAQAALLMVGRRLGAGDDDGAYRTARRLLRDGLVASLALAVVIVALRTPYVAIFQVDPAVKATTKAILIVFAVMFPLRVANMILSSGVLRSGGKTSYIMAISLAGTWCVGVPLGLLSAFVWHLPVVWVYALVAQEETAKFLISIALFRSRRWMKRL
ncbi:MAG: MATE family efflux transporter [Bifidobacteriaceae bacterium]|nr:MATE family efflux transporter [Bifidobacteriaceae bacterium]